MKIPSKLPCWWIPLCYNSPTSRLYAAEEALKSSKAYLCRVLLHNWTLKSNKNTVKKSKDQEKKYVETRSTCITSQRDQAVLAASMVRDPFIHSSMEDPFIDGSGLWFWVWGYHFINFMGGPFTKANTKAPETLITEPSTLAIPCSFLMDTLSNLEHKINH